MIEIHDLVKDHGRQRVLDGVSLTVRRGEAAAIIGPSGGGKSTLLRCINGLETFQDGVIHVDDLVLRPGSQDGAAEQTLRAVRRRVGMVFQQFHLFPHLSVMGNVTCALRCVLRQSREEAEATALELLRRVGMHEKATARPAQLSGGQQQRVAIARALALRPEAILFDEPTSALDPRNAAEVLKVIAELAAAGQTMLVVTHAMGFARRVSSTVHVMHAGKIIESGPPDRVFVDPTHAATRSFLKESDE